MQPTAMPAVIDEKDVVRFREVEELERLWHGESSGDPGPAGAHTEATITITRNAPDDIQDRTVNLWLDGEPWEPIRYGRTLTRNIAAGTHKVKAHNTLFGATVEFEAKPGEHVRLTCANTMSGGGQFMMLLIGWGILRVRLEREK